MGEIYDRYRLLSSGDLNNLYIYIGNHSSYESNDYKSLCDVMNKLQSQPFSINSDWLHHLLDDENCFVELGLLMPQFLSTLNIRDVSSILREFHMKNEVINKVYSFTDLLNTVIKNIQRSRYERLILNLARAYEEGYHFYLPAFLDFRGRIYRSGIFHFHERDLARSLIVFADYNHDLIMVSERDCIISNNEMLNIVLSIFFHFKSFNSLGEASSYIVEEGIHDGKKHRAKRPFQFSANICIQSK